MEINALMMDWTDNVVTCVKEVAAGETVAYRKDGELCTLQLSHRQGPSGQP